MTPMGNGSICEPDDHLHGIAATMVVNRVLSALDLFSIARKIVQELLPTTVLPIIVGAPSPEIYAGAPLYTTAVEVAC